jgi:hypothetical protein
MPLRANEMRAGVSHANSATYSSRRTGYLDQRNGRDKQDGRRHPRERRRTQYDSELMNAPSRRDEIMLGLECLLFWSLLGAKRTWAVAAHMSAFDPKRTFVCQIE